MPSHLLSAYLRDLEEHHHVNVALSLDNRLLSVGQLHCRAGLGMLHYRLDAKQTQHLIDHPQYEGKPQPELQRNGARWQDRTGQISTWST